MDGSNTSQHNNSRRERNKHCTRLYTAEITTRKLKNGFIKKHLVVLWIRPNQITVKYPSIHACSYFNDACSFFYELNKNDK